MTPIRLAVTGALLFVAASFSGCDCCRVVQTPSTCWTHEGVASEANCKARRDDKEPNDLLPIASATTISCEPHTLQGTLGPRDVDVYQARGDICKGSQPQASWEASHGRLCLFAGCEHGLMTFTGCKAGTPMHFREGILGCCVDGPGRVELESRCSIGETALQAWLVVDQSGGDCEDYDVSFND
jgi:hypothetical protein